METYLEHPYRYSHRTFKGRVKQIEYRELHHVRTDAKVKFSLVIGQGKQKLGVLSLLQEGNKGCSCLWMWKKRGIFLSWARAATQCPHVMHAKSAGNVKGNRSADNDWVECTDGVYNTTDNGIGTFPESKLHVKSLSCKCRG